MTLTPDLTTICLIALAVVFLILMGGFLMIRVMRGSIFGLGMILMRLLTEGKQAAEVEEHVVQVTPHAVTDLRAQAQSLDFDAAVAKYEQQDEPPPTQNPTPPVPGYPLPDQPPNHEDPNNAGLPR